MTMTTETKFPSTNRHPQPGDKVKVSSVVVQYHDTEGVFISEEGGWVVIEVAENTYRSYPRENISFIEYRLVCHDSLG